MGNQIPRMFQGDGKWKLFSMFGNAETATRKYCFISLPVFGLGRNWKIKFV